MALGSHRIAEITGPMRPVTATELSPPDLLIGERESQQGVPSGGHRAGRGETMRGASRCTRTARAHTRQIKTCCLVTWACLTFALESPRW